MMRLVRARTHRRLKLSGVLLLASVATAATLLGTGVAGSSNTGSGSQPPGPVVGTLNVGPSSIDHFACYVATNSATIPGPLFNVPKIVQLKNQFGGFYGIVGPLFYHCNPTQKTLPPTAGGVTTPPTPITNPNAHLACFRLSVPSPQAPMTVQMTNQFGTGTLTTGQPRILCLPSWKNLAATSVPALSEPPGLDHYVCYSVAKPAMPAPPAGIVLQDQFNTMQSPPSQTTVTLGRPNLACLPSLKTINANTAVPVPGTLIHPEAHMVCYPITAVTNPAGPTGGSVTDFNQWGVGVVTIGTLNELCVPSLKSQRVPTNTIVVSKTVQDPLTGGAGVAGVVFQAVPSIATNPSGSCTTDPSGTCSITGLGIDTYTVSEVSAPPPYNVTLAPPQTTVFIAAPQTNVLGFTDPPPQGSNTIDIAKLTNPNSTSGGTPLGGATFTAVPTVNLANPTGSCTTTLPSGACQITGLGVDTYLVSETVPPSGYAPVAPQPVTFTTSPQTQNLTFFDNPITTQVSNTAVITKYGLIGTKKVKLAGAVFTAVPLNPINPVGTCTSTAIGLCTITGLGIDTYTIIETTVPAGYSAAPNSTITFVLAPQTIVVPPITDLAAAGG